MMPVGENEEVGDRGIEYARASPSARADQHCRFEAQPMTRSNSEIWPGETRQQWADRLLEEYRHAGK